MLKKFWEWLVKSSATPEQTALTVRGFLHTAAAVVLMVSPLFHLNLGQTQLDQAVDLSTQLIIAMYGVVSALVAVYGFARKLYLTFKNPMQ